MSVPGVNTVSFNEMSNAVQNEPEVKIQPIENQPTTSPGESKKALNAKEAEHIATSPALRLLVQEKILNEKLTNNRDLYNKFPLVIELFKVKIEMFKQAGGSMDELTKELKERVATESRAPFVGEHHELREDLGKLYAILLGDAAQMVDPNNYCNPYLKIYALEKATGCIVKGKDLLAQEFIHLGRVEKPLWALYKESGKKVFHLFSVLHFTETTFFPTVLKIIKHTETDPAFTQEFLKGYINRFSIPYDYDKEAVSYFYGLFSKNLPNWDRHLTAITPYLIQYGALSQAKESFEAANKSLPSWERAYKWVDLCCQTAEACPEKAIEYIALANKEVFEQLWALPFSPHQTAILDTEKKAKERIAQVTLPQKSEEPLALAQKKIDELRASPLPTPRQKLKEAQERMKAAIES